MSARAPAWAWLLPAIVFLCVAIVQLVREGKHGMTFLVLGLVFLVLGLSLLVRDRNMKPPPPAA